MTEQELREKVAQREVELHRSYYLGKYGNHCWNDLPPLMKAEVFEKADQLIKDFRDWFKQANYVRLADDQSLPKGNCFYAQIGDIADEARQGMLKVGFRKVEL